MFLPFFFYLRICPIKNRNENIVKHKRNIYIVKNLSYCEFAQNFFIILCSIFLECV